MGKVFSTNGNGSTTGPGGHESCGYHTLKNTILSLMKQQGLIDERQFTRMLSDPGLFKAIFNATKSRANAAGNLDLTLNRFIQIVENLRNGHYDFSAYGISNEALQALNLDENLIAAQTYTYVGMYELGHAGHEEDLVLAAALANLSKISGKKHHPFHRAFALGLNDEHWVAVTLIQNDSGEQIWQFMDSWRNQSRYKELAVNKINSVLNKNDLELKAYLRTTYDNANVLLQRRYERLFDEVTGLPKPKSWGWGVHEDEAWDAKDYFVKQKDIMEQHSTQFVNRFKFMKSVGWLTSENEVEKTSVRQLYILANYILQNAEDTAVDRRVKLMLEPVCTELKRSLGIDVVEMEAEIPVIPEEGVQAKNTVTEISHPANNTQAPVIEVSTPR